MIVAKQIFDIARAILELGYYLAGIAIAYIAYRGLAQITLTKEIAATTAKRESFKLAVEQCHFFAKEVVPGRSKLIETAKAKGLHFGSPKSYRISQGEIVALDVSGRDTGRESVALGLDLVQHANRIDAFAMAFASGLADEMVGSRETALAFCQAVPEVLPFIDLCRKQGIARYESTVQLLEIWSARLVSQELTKKKQEIDQHLAGLKDTKIKAIGTE